MPTQLEVASTNHGRVMVAPPRINLRRAKSYNGQDCGPLSATSSRFSYNHLLFSPPPSPSLPSLVPRPRRTGSDLLLKSRPSRVLRYGFLATLFASALYIFALAFRNRGSIPEIWSCFGQPEFEMVGQDDLPDFPTPILVTDVGGRSRWTVSIPPSQSFPLSMDQYASMGVQCREVSARAREMHRNPPLSKTTLARYDDSPDDNFVDVAEGERFGLLPPTPLTAVPKGAAGRFVGLDIQPLSMPVCDRSMTYVLESTDAGMGNSLMMMWMSYGLAKEEGRAFFVDDSRWAYGDYTEIFQPPPAPTCRPPPRHHMVPCPLQARHLVVSGTTAKEMLPSLVSRYRRKAGSGNRDLDLWRLAHAGYEALFHLNKEDRAYVDTRVRDLKNKSKRGITAPGAPIIGMHVRRGDQHPFEYQYKDTYIPAEVFHENAQKLSEILLSSASARTEGHAPRNEPITVLASDDPTVQDQPDFESAMPAQQRIRLASKDQMKQSKPGRKFIHQFTEEAFGWEGGFFAPMFWNLGVDRRNNAANAPKGVDVVGANVEAQHLAPASRQTIKLRSFVGRAYAMDLAVLAEASDGVVCAVSAMGCRLLGAMMEWEKGVGGHGWVNVDGDYGWTGIN